MDEDILIVVHEPEETLQPTRVVISDLCRVIDHEGREREWLIKGLPLPSDQNVTLPEDLTR